MNKTLITIGTGILKTSLDACKDTVQVLNEETNFTLDSFWSSGQQYLDKPLNYQFHKDGELVAEAVWVPDNDLSKLYNVEYMSTTEVTPWRLWIKGVNA